MAEFLDPFQPLPDLGAPFDLITAHMTCFNRRADGSHWGVAEWEYFVKDAESRLTPTGPNVEYLCERRYPAL